MKSLSGLLSLCVMAVAILPAVAAPPVVPAKNDFTATYHRIWSTVSEQYQCGDISGWSRYEHKYDGKLVSQNALRIAVDDMLSAARDSRLRLLTTDEAQRHVARQAGGYAGVGIAVEPCHFVRDKVTVKRVLEDTPAEDAGLKAGDEIVAVNGVKLALMEFKRVGNMLRGKPGTIAKLAVHRGAEALEISVKRDLDENLGVDLTLVNPTKLYRVTRVVVNSPAESSGIKSDDLVSAVDGDVCDHLSDDEFFERLRGSMGSKVTIKVFRSGKEKEIDVVRGIVSNWSLFVGYSTRSSLKFGTQDTRGCTMIPVKSLDWAAVATWFDEHMVGMNQHDASILDLRGCSGRPDAAARVAARFVESGELLRYKTRTEEVVFSIGTDRVLRRTITTSSGRVSTEVVETVSQCYQNTLVVVIDNQTKGAGAALAAVLKRLGRASLVGTSTSADFVGCVTEIIGAGDSAVYLQLPGYVLLDSAGKPLTSVSPDRRVWFGNVMDEAEKEIVGLHWYNDPLVLVAGGIFAVVLVLISVLQLLSRRSTTKACDGVVDAGCCGDSGNKDAGAGNASLPAEEVAGCCGDSGNKDTGAGNASLPAEEVAGCCGDSGNKDAGAGNASLPAEEVVGCCGGDAVANEGEPAADNSPTANTSSGAARSDGTPVDTSVEKPSPGDLQTGGPTPGGNRLRRHYGNAISLFIALVVVLGGVWLFSWWTHLPPGAHSEVIVEFYTDGSERCDQQALVIERLKREYDGPIRFETIDVRKQPFFTPEQPGDRTYEVRGVPTIRVRYRWLDKDGKCIASGSQWGGRRTKRALVADIETAQTNLSYSYPLQERITRHRGR